MTWTQEREDAVKKLWGDGLSATQIANRIGGCSRSSVLGKVHRLKLAKRAPGDRNPLGNNGRPRGPTKAALKTAIEQKRRARSLAQLEAAITTVSTAPAPETAIPFMETRDEHCRWPVGEPQDFANFKVCGATRYIGAYCPYHSRIAYVPVRSRSEIAA